MATLYKCDKCGKIIKNDHSFNVHIYDFVTLLDEKDCPWPNFHLCKKCAMPFSMYLKRFFAKKYKKTNPKHW